MAKSIMVTKKDRCFFADNAYSKGYSEEDCKKKAEQAARTAITSDIKPKYLEAISKGDYETANSLRSFMYRSKFYKDKKGKPSLKTVDNLIEDWKQDVKDKAERIKNLMTRSRE